MKITAKLQGIVSTGVNNHVGDILLGADPAKAINGIVSDIVSDTVQTLASQTSSLINNTINNAISDKLSDILEVGGISGNFDQIKYALMDGVSNKISQTVDNILPDDINFLTNNLDTVKDSVSSEIELIKSTVVSGILDQFSDYIPNVSDVTTQINNVIDSLVTSQVNTVIDSVSQNFGKTISDTIEGGLDSILGKDLAGQLGDAAAGEAMSAISGFKMVVGSAINKTIIGQGTVTVGAGSKLSTILPGAISLGAGASLMKLGGGMISLGSGASKVSIGDGDIKIGGQSAVNKSPTITLTLTGDVTGTANVTLENLTSNAFTLSVLKNTIPENKGLIPSSGSVTFDASGPDVQLVTVGGSHTWSFTNWPVGYRQIRILTTNAGLGTITFPTMTWFKGDGTSYPSFSSIGVTLNTSGPNVFEIWSPDGGTTIFGRAF